MSKDAERVDRRTVLGAIGAAGAFGLAGCVGGDDGGSDPDGGTETGETERTETPKPTPTGTPTATQTHTPTPTARPDLEAGVAIEKKADGLGVTLVSLGANAAGVELGGCAEDRQLSSVGERVTLPGCDGDGQLDVFAVGEDGGRELVRRFPEECDGETGGKPVAGFSIETNPDRADAEVTVTSLGDNTRGIRIRGCWRSERVYRVGETAKVRGCSEGDTFEVVGVGCDGDTAVIREQTVEDTSTATPSPTPWGTVDVQRTGDGDGYVVTLVELKDHTDEVRLEGCVDGETLDEVGATTAVTTCSRGDTIRAIPVGPDGEEGPSQTVTLEEPPVPDSIGLSVSQGESGFTVEAIDQGESVTGVEIGGCGEAKTIRQGESVTVSDCGGSIRLTAHHAEAPSVVLGEFRSETTADGHLPAATFTLVRNASRAGVTTTDTGDAVASVSVEGCGGDLGGGRIDFTEDCDRDELVTVAVSTEE